ncbi:hypothetical protein [Ramlibacter humi]|uniref:Uncharacterized protein n=1 Tax=Ramlibacter humi TaxID=2530451 RepID=A0A4Z0CCD1_9BURK|nr:hypothetical protein [Ramlibacter humi]TFZ08118.1 hypothetical protein EZ216_02835 [Ramlibacter humi]
MPNPDTSPTRAKTGTDPAPSAPAEPDHGENTASTLIEAPMKPRRSRLEAHDFPDGGGSGGAEAFRRSRVK